MEPAISRKSLRHCTIRERVTDRCPDFDPSRHKVYVNNVAVASGDLDRPTHQLDIIDVRQTVRS